MLTEFGLYLVMRTLRKFKSDVSEISEESQSVFLLKQEKSVLNILSGTQE